MTDFSHELRKLAEIQGEIDNLTRLTHSGAKLAYLAPLLIKAMSVVHDVYQSESQAEREIRFFAEGLTESNREDLATARFVIGKAIDAIRLEERTRSDQLAAALVAISRQHLAHPLPHTANASASSPPFRHHFISPARIEDLRRLPIHGMDPKRLIRLLEEINHADAQDCLITVATLCRHVMNHVPPVFGFDKFVEVVANYGGGASFKGSAQALQNSLKNIADGHAHLPMRATESLPMRQQINFGPDMDRILEEVVRLLQDRANAAAGPAFGTPNIGHAS